jgi:hypothetical protein
LALAMLVMVGSLSLVLLAEWLRRKGGQAGLLKPKADNL